MKREYRGQEKGKERVIIITINKEGKTLAEKAIYGNSKEEAIKNAILVAGEDKKEDQDFSCMKNGYPGFLWIESIKLLK